MVKKKSEIVIDDRLVNINPFLDPEFEKAAKKGEEGIIEYLKKFQTESQSPEGTGKP